MRTRKPHHTIAAIAMLTAMMVSTFEPVAGELQDAGEHYADVVVSDDNAPNGELVVTNGSDDGQHIKGYDHCGHVHGSAVRGPELVVPTVATIPLGSVSGGPLTPPDALTAPLYHPPKA